MSFKNALRNLGHIDEPTMQELIDAKDRRIEILEAALREIAECHFTITENENYTSKMMNHARRALEKKT